MSGPWPYDIKLYVLRLLAKVRDEPVPIHGRGNQHTAIGCPIRRCSVSPRSRLYVVCRSNLRRRDAPPPQNRAPAEVLNLQHVLRGSLLELSLEQEMQHNLPTIVITEVPQFPNNNCHGCLRQDCVMLCCVLAGMAKYVSVWKPVIEHIINLHVLHYTLLYSTMPYHTMPYYNILYYTILCYAMLFYTILYCTIL